jgi:hypothetical protein
MSVGVMDMDGASRFFFLPKKKKQEEGVWGGMVRIVNGEVVDDNAPDPPSSLGAFPSFSSGSLLHCISA